MFQFVENCKEFFTRIVRCIIELRTVRILIGEFYAVVIELRAARCLLGNCAVLDWVENCKKFVRRIVKC